jgi:hypothetical protein
MFSLSFRKLTLLLESVFAVVIVEAKEITKLVLWELVITFIGMEVTISVELSSLRSLVLKINLILYYQIKPYSSNEITLKL